MREEFPVEVLSISRLRLDGDAQSRVQLDAATVTKYRAVVGDLPPIEVCFDGTDYWPWDYAHRLQAHVEEGKTEIRCRVRPGTEEDAWHLSLAANETHGLPRSDADRRNAILRCYKKHPDWKLLQIANACSVTWATAEKWVERIKKGDESLSNKPRETFVQEDALADQPKAGDTFPASYIDIPKSGDIPAKEIPPKQENSRARVPSLSDVDERIPDELEDAEGQVIPSKLVDVFAQTILDYVGPQLKSMIPGIEDAMKWCPWLRPTGKESLSALEHMQNAFRQIDSNKPFAVCRKCGGKGCDQCRGCGWLPEWKVEDLKLNGGWE